MVAKLIITFGIFLILSFTMIGFLPDVKVSQMGKHTRWFAVTLVIIFIASFVGTLGSIITWVWIQ